MEIDFPSGFSDISILGYVTTIDTVCNSYAGSQAQLHIAPVNTRAKLRLLFLWTENKMWMFHIL